MNLVQFAGDAAVGASSLSHADDLALDRMRVSVPALIGALLSDDTDGRLHLVEHGQSVLGQTQHRDRIAKASRMQLSASVPLCVQEG